MLWNKILGAIKAEGYNGADDDLPAVQQFLKDNFDGGITGPDGKVVNVEAAYDSFIENKSLREELEVANLTNELSGANKNRGALVTKSANGSFGKIGAATISGVRDRFEDSPYLAYHDEPFPVGKQLKDIIECGGNGNGPARL